MNEPKSKGPVFDPGLCRCCGSLKKCRVLNVEYESMGKKIIYSDMIMDCFGLLLANLDGTPSQRLICATCVTRLREASTFREQVLRCEEAFLHARMYDDNIDNTKTNQNSLENHPKIEVEVKTEPVDDESRGSSPPHHNVEPDDDDCVDDPMDEVPLSHHMSRSAPSLPPSPVVKKPRKEINPASLILMRVKRDKPIRPIPMGKLQQRMRERDPSYMMETNILSIVEFSYVCPFKCRHNHLLCYYCGQSFSDPTGLREHTLKIHHPKKFKVIEHKKMIKIDLTRIDCRLCSIKIDSLDAFKDHITSAHKKKYYFDYKDSVLPFRLIKNDLKCALCNESFPYFHALNKHMNKHFSNYVCETCGLGFVDQGRFVMHQQRHEEGDFPCEQCGKVFKAVYNRDLHIDRVHNKRGRVYCPKCDVKLMSYPQKLKHLVEVHGEEPMSFPCDQCEKICDTRRTLTIHKRKDHLKDYRYECQYCGQKFFTRFALTNHMPTHTGERNYKCKVCEKSYPRLKTLKDHMRIHTNDRRYRCHICGQAFIQNCSLKGHLKSQHPEYG